LHLLRTRSARILRLSLFVASFALAILAKKVYRPWAYHRGVGWFNVVDWGPSLFYVFGMMMLAATLIAATRRLRHLKYQTMAGIAVGALMYEISHAFRSDRWFGWDDVTATVVGGLAAILVEAVLTRVEGKPDSRSTSH
jgi:hypothetical protein